ncbi:MAG TPA: M20/M25/M40 family metallo-hydrolase [Ignavibacteriaceae bacterium]|nr:M20/M25/M40 family metallo-hydrolase [Ignavibacteriaceae bacterium]
MYKKILFTLTFIFCTTLTFASETLHHKISVTVNPSKHFIEAVDEITIPASQIKPNMFFLLNKNLTVLSETPGVSIKLDESEIKAEDLGIDREDFNSSSDYTQNKYLLSFENNEGGEVTFLLKISGIINYQITQLGEEYARGFSQTPGIIDEKGVYLAGSTFWVPWFSNEWISFELTATVPQDWNVVSQGSRTLNETKNESRVVRWDSPEPMEEIYLIAAQFTEYSEQAGSIDVMAFLRTPDEALANKYLEATAQYLEMYRKLVGSYPFTKFALVENFWETGYGMPSFTLLGEQIIRFPFILNSSYPHELLHNYWGNSVYVDFKTGNWCEGLTAYMADHLIAEQRGQGDEYRRSTLQKYTDYVKSSNDFPLSEFGSRYNASSEAIGYGKSLMMWNMLREKVGDELFVQSFQNFYLDNKYKAASFDDIRLSFEAVTGKNLKQFFDQWVTRKGAPELALSNVFVQKENENYQLNFTLKQIQSEDVFVLDVPVAVSFENKIETKKIEMTEKEQTFQLTFSENPLLVQVDPQFNLFRKLHYNEIPPSLSKIFGSEEVLILLPSKADPVKQEYYKKLADIWAADSSQNFKISFDNEISELPSTASIWILGEENIFSDKVKSGIKDYNAELTEDMVQFGAASFDAKKNSLVISVRHPNNPAAVLVFLSTDNKEAIEGLARKLPHYGKYSYLVFEGNEPTNIGKGEWETVNSPLSAKVGTTGKSAATNIFTEIPKRSALASLDPVFSSDRMMKAINYLASEELQGRAPGTEGINKAADFIVEKFKSAGLLPGADDGTYFQSWDEVVDANGNKAKVKNIIGIIPGTNPDLKDESVIVSAHYDHLGYGWPESYKGNAGKIHLGADDNASGVAVMLELAELLGKSLKPQRTVIFVAFTSEESGLLGSKYYVKNMQHFPAKKVIGVLNFDTVGRLGKNKILVIGSNSANEWKFIFMGASYVTGVESEMVTQDLDASDQVSFIEAGIPAVQFFSGANEDYHKPTDTPDKIDASGLIKVATFAREGILYLADRLEPLTFQGQTTGDTKKTETPTVGRKVSTGSVPDFAFSGEGVRIADLSPDSPAEKAGLQKGDVIIQLDKYKVKNLKDYSEALKNFKPGDIVEVIYLRNGVESKAKIELIAK